MLNRFGDYLDEVTRGLKAEKGVRRQRIRQAWEEAVGSLIAKNSEPLKIKGDTLIVRVTDTAWAQELSLRQNEILKRLGLGDRTPSRLRCWVGQVQDLSAPPSPRDPKLRLVPARGPGRAPGVGSQVGLSDRGP